METTKKLDMLKSFEMSYDPSLNYKITKTDGTIIVAKIVDYNKAVPGELFYDPETGNTYDSEEIPVNIFFTTKSDPIPEKINFRQIQDIKPLINS